MAYHVEQSNLLRRCDAAVIKHKLFHDIFWIREASIEVSQSDASKASDRGLEYSVTISTPIKLNSGRT